MPLTETQRLLRRSHLGSSDVAAVLGLSPWRTAVDVWMEKTGRLVERDEPTNAMQAGNLLEPVLLAWAEGRLGELRRAVAVEGPKPLMANIDGIVSASGEPVEAKTAAIVRPWVEADNLWGAEASDEVPPHVLIQCQVHMLVTDRPICHVPALVGGRGFLLYHVPRSVTICERIVEGATDFWKLVEEQRRPEGSASPASVKLLKRVPGEVGQVAPDLVADWLKARAEATVAKKHKEQLQADIIEAMGQAEAALCGEAGAVTYYEQQRGEYTVAESTYRVLRHKKKGL